MREKTQVELVGGGGLAKDIVACFQHDIDITGIWDDALKPGTLFHGLPVLGSINNLPKAYERPLLIAVGNPVTRKKIAEALKAKEVRLHTAVHSTAKIFNPATVQLAAGCILMPFSYLTDSITLDENCLLHLQSGLHHDVHLRAHSVLMPGAKITCSFQSPECYLLDTNQVMKI